MNYSTPKKYLVVLGFKEAQLKKDYSTKIRSEFFGYFINQVRPSIYELPNCVIGMIKK